MPHLDIGDHPAIANALATGYPDGMEPEEYQCPVCGKECECVYTHKESGEVAGCDRCLDEVEPWEVSECRKY